MLRAIKPADLKARMDAGDELVLLDVREPREVAICAFPGAVHIPLGDVAARLFELDPAVPIVCICHHGIRSANVAGLLAQRDFEDVYNLMGGIDRWAQEVEPAMARY